MELCPHGTPLTKDQLLRAVQFRAVEIEYKGHWLRLDAICFFEWLTRKCPNDLTFNADVVGFVIRIKTEKRTESDLDIFFGEH